MERAAVDFQKALVCAEYIKIEFDSRVIKAERTGRFPYSIIQEGSFIYIQHRLYYSQYKRSLGFVYYVWRYHKWKYIR